ncbi:MAG: hypothetical protein ACOYK6_04535 [Chthoniobacterales bacterium]
MILILIPILAMLALGFIVPGKTPLKLKSFLGILLFFFSVLLGVRCLISSKWFYPEADAITHVHGQVDHLLRRPGWQKKPVLILEGSSATEFGIDPELLEKKLVEKGIDVTVLKFALSGANHFERLFMMQIFLEELGKLHRSELKQAPVILMSEVFDAYDQSPLYLFFKESNTQRSLVWLEPHNVLIAWRALQASSSEGENLYSIFLEHLFLNRFAVGIFSTLEPLCYHKKVSGFYPLQKAKGTFDYSKTQEAFEKAMVTSDASPKIAMPPPGWRIYYRELYTQMGSIVHSLAFYALPVLEVQRRDYQSAFAAALPAHTLMLGPASPQFMKTVLQKNYWFDGVHPTGAGAPLFTEWLAEEISAHWVEILATRWKMENVP